MLLKSWCVQNLNIPSAPGVMLSECMLSTFLPLMSREAHTGHGISRHPGVQVGAASLNLLKGQEHLRLKKALGDAFSEGGGLSALGLCCRNAHSSSADGERDIYKYGNCAQLMLRGTGAGFVIPLYQTPHCKSSVIERTMHFPNSQRPHVIHDTCSWHTTCHAGKITLMTM